MNAAYLVLFTGACFFLGYRIYSRFLADRVYQTGAKIIMPAHTLKDGVDFVPTHSHVLFGHHFASIAGAAPIVGPAIAVTWGWLPALLWVIVGTIFIGAVHDFGCLVISAKNQGRSIADLTAGVVGRRARFLFLALILVLAWLVLAVFAFVIAKLFVDYPSTVLPINFQIFVAVVIGLVLYRGKAKLLIPSLVALFLLYLVIPLGVQNPMGGYSLFLSESSKTVIEGDLSQKKLVLNDHLSRLQGVPSTARPLVLASHYQERAHSARERAHSAGERSPRAGEKPPRAGEKPRRQSPADFEVSKLEATAADILSARDKAINVWIYLLLAYSFVASILPVWVLLQPRDYINSHQLILALGILFFAVLWTRPVLQAPALNLDVADAPPWFPFLFVTIACGAISGFHGLVSSGTTSKQLDQLKHARAIGYGGMLGEGALGLMSVIACTAGFASSTQWQNHYATWSSAKGKEIDAFVEGCAYLLEQINIAPELALTFVGMIVIAFSATTLDTATRIQRYIISEIGGTLGIRQLQNRFVAGAIAATMPIFLLVGSFWKQIWPVFGAANQMLAGLSLVILAAYLAQKKAPTLPVVIPMVFLIVMASWGLMVQVGGFYRTGNYLLLGISALLLVLSIFIILEGVLAFQAAKQGRKAPEKLR